jgi:hypothetical protein
METIADVFSESFAQDVMTWKICSRFIADTLLEEVSSAIDIEIENLQKLREQELLCKGMFTELW